MELRSGSHPENEDCVAEKEGLELRAAGEET